MKTALRILFDDLKESVKDEEYVVANGSEYHPNDVKQANVIISCVYNVLTKIEPLFKNEENQIIAAYEAGVWDAGCRATDADEYFNDTYKTVSK